MWVMCLLRVFKIVINWSFVLKFILLGWFFLDVSIFMFVNVRVRVYRVLDVKLNKKVKILEKMSSLEV